jgi:hypothetical protein
MLIYREIAVYTYKFWQGNRKIPVYPHSGISQAGISRDDCTYTGFLEELKALGCSVEVVGGSVAEMTTVEEIVATSPKPIAGVLHAPVVVWV